MLLAHVQNIILQVLVQYIPGCFRVTPDPTDTQPLALTQSMKHQAAMFTNDTPICGLDITGLCWNEVGQESSEVSFSDKADSGAVFLVVHSEPGFKGQLPNRWFEHFTYREYRFGELLMTHCIKKITLILLMIQPP